MADCEVIAMATAPAPARVDAESRLNAARGWLAGFRNDIWRLPWRGVILPSAQAWVTSRAVIAIATVMILLLAHQNDQHTSLTLYGIVHTWNAFDTPWYIFIAQYGYTANQAFSTVYFPLYPLLIHLGIGVVGAQHAFIVGLVISNASLLFALLGLAALARIEGVAPRLALSALLAYPLAFFLSAAYTESTFMAFTIWALVCARRGRWLLAALLAALATATRVTGVILWAPLLWEFITSFEWRALEAWTTQRVVAASALAGAVPGTLVAYMIYCWAKFGDALAFIHGQTMWTHRFLWPWETLAWATYQWRQIPPLSYPLARVAIDVLPWLVCAALTAGLIAARMRVSYILYMLPLLALCVASPLVQNTFFPYLFVSAARYLLAAIPLWLLLARWLERWPWLEGIFIHGGFVIQAALLSVFLLGGWIV
jgi:hypothetical protein